MSARHRLFLPATAILFGLAACGSTPVPVSAPVAVTTSPSASAAAPTATTAAPTSAAPKASVTAKPTKTPERRSGNPACPSAKTLDRLADLPKDWSFPASGIECWKVWATAAPKSPTPGDGIYLFKYTSGKGWKFHSQGSGYHCADIGIDEAAPFCQYP